MSKSGLSPEESETGSNKVLVAAPRARDVTVATPWRSQEILICIVLTWMGKVTMKRGPGIKRAKLYFKSQCVANIRAGASRNPQLESRGSAQSYSEVPRRF